ncbi:hypothetical protein [Burkholderia sp. BCC1985]|uniref:hypothetical protein n=1 Tax=Burkholderia sp. BCC1985 TaxID=2817442 RepID=UPI002AB320D6|nr:hypothetical protein [Burkholderia sp. BCC1985]
MESWGVLVREALARAKTGDSFKRLARVLSGQAMPHAQLAQWIIAHDGLPADACAQIAVLAGRSIDFIEIDASTGDYDRLFACTIWCATTASPAPRYPACTARAQLDVHVERWRAMLI